ncbi:MAG: hypothetical protein QM692_17480, partial [Thermomicrobiales bacterium]
YNFYKGFLQDLATAGRADGARNLGIALVIAGTLSMVVAVWNYWMVERALGEIRDTLQIPPGVLPRWVVAYALSAVLIAIGCITLVFMLRVI